MQHFVDSNQIWNCHDIPVILKSGGCFNLTLPELYIFLHGKLNIFATTLDI